MRTDKWRKPEFNNKRSRSKSSGTKSNKASAVADRKRRNKILSGYPKLSFIMSKEQLDKYFDGDSITCLLCGKEYRTLGGPHLQKIHGISEDSYRETYGIPYTQGLSCGELLDLRKKQGLDKIKNLKPMSKEDCLTRKKARIGNAAKTARQNNIKIATAAHTTSTRMKIGKKIRKLTDEQVKQILHSTKMNIELAKIYNVSTATISLIKNKHHSYVINNSEEE